MNRGVDRHDIFSTDLDRRIFLDEVGSASEEFGVDVHAYCLMTTHFHLVLHCPDGQLSEFVRTLSRRYVEGYNRRTEREGPLFTGRFRHTTLHRADDDVTRPDPDPDRSLKMAVRYVHRNPLDFLPSSALASYAYSTYPAYLGRRRPPPWLCRHVVESLCGSPEEIERFTMRPLPTDSTPPFGRRPPTFSSDDVVVAVGRVAGLRREAILAGSRGVRNDARAVAAHLCVSSRTGSSAELAAFFGVATQQALRQLAARGKRLVAVDASAATLRGRALEILRRSAAAA